MINVAMTLREISKHVELCILCLTKKFGIFQEEQKYKTICNEASTRRGWTAHAEVIHKSIIAPISKQLVTAQHCMPFRRLIISKLLFTCAYHVSYSRCAEFRHVWQPDTIILTAHCWEDKKFAWKALDINGLWIFPTQTLRVEVEQTLRNPAIWQKFNSIDSRNDFSPI